MNVKLLKQVKAAILEHPKQFEMVWWFQEVLSALPRIGEPEPPSGCGTAACIGGWALALTLAEKGPVTLKQASRNRGQDDYRGLLEINLQQADRLFFLNEWPQRFWNDYKTSKSYEGRAKAAARRIDHFIKTNGDE